jgi:hypothetical protein
MAFTIKQNDTAPSVEAVLKNSAGSAVDLTGATVNFHMKDLSGTVVVAAAASVTDDIGGTVQYDWIAADTDTAGTFYAEFEVEYPDGTIETFPNTGSVAVNIVKELN